MHNWYRNEKEIKKAYEALNQNMIGSRWMCYKVEGIQKDI